MTAKGVLKTLIRSAVTTVAAVSVDWFLRPSTAGDEGIAFDTATVFSVAAGPVFLAVLIANAAAGALPKFGLRALVQSLSAASLACLTQLAAVSVTSPELLHGFVGQMAAIGLELFVTLFVVNLAWEYRSSLAAPDADSQDSPSARTTP